MDHNKMYFQKLSNRKTGFPLATVAYYGPDSQLASKLVVGIFARQKDKDITNIRKWFYENKDIREDAKLFQEMIDFINENQVHRIALVDRIIGCPHEEGIDYAEGEQCPVCPFWKNRDRWTGELIGK